MNAKVSIAGSAVSAVNAESGATVHIHVAAEVSQQPDDPSAAINRAVATLLKCAQTAGCQPVLERISHELYGTKLFKTLRPAQLAALQKIADELIAHAAAADGVARAELTVELERIRDALASALASESQRHIAAERAMAEARAELASTRKMLVATMILLAISLAAVGAIGVKAHALASERDAVIQQLGANK